MRDPAKLLRSAVARSTRSFAAMSNESIKEREELIAEIVRAFDGVTLGYGITLHEAIAIDDYKTQEERMAARRLDKERQWQDVSAAALLECESALSFLDESGFRYYLPAFMVKGLEDWDKKAGVPVDSCVYHLLHDYPHSLRESEPSTIAAKRGFNDAQCRAIAHFLRFVIGPDDEFPTEDPTTRQAVAKWERFVNERVPAT